MWQIFVFIEQTIFYIEQIFFYRANVTEQIFFYIGRLNFTKIFIVLFIMKVGFCDMSVGSYL
jgi:hypothetical protein